MYIAVDFDGTVVEHRYPELGRPVPHAIRVLRNLVEDGHKIILWTMRDGDELDAAFAYLAGNGVVPFGVNENPAQHWSSSRKAYAHKYIDDAAVGCPLIHPEEGRPYVDWLAVEREFYPKAGHGVVPFGL